MTAHATASTGGSGYWWLWLIIALVVLVVVGTAIVHFANTRSRRREWYGLATDAYERGMALAGALKSGRQTHSEFTTNAQNYDSVLRHLQARSPSENTRWAVARVTVTFEELSHAVAEHPGTEAVRTSTADFEAALHQLRDAASANPLDAELFSRLRNFRGLLTAGEGEPGSDARQRHRGGHIAVAEARGRRRSRDQQRAHRQRQQRPPAPRRHRRMRAATATSSTSPSIMPRKMKTFA